MVMRFVGSPFAAGKAFGEAALTPLLNSTVKNDADHQLQTKKRTGRVPAANPRELLCQDMLKLGDF